MKQSLNKLFLAVVLTLSPLVSADEWNGKTYQKHSETQKLQSEILLKRLSLQGDERILDIGCGTGWMSLEMAKQLPDGEVVGLDPSPSMLAAANLLPEQSNLRFVEGYAENFALEGSFDYAVAIHSLHWIKDQEMALANIAQHLVSGGKTYFLLAPSKEGLPFYRALTKTVAHWSQELYSFVSNQQSYDLETYRRYMVRAGFQIDEMRYTRMEQIFASPAHLTSWLIQWLPHYKFLPAEKKDLFAAELTQNYLLEVGYGEGPVFWEEYVLVVEAIKP